MTDLFVLLWEIVEIFRSLSRFLWRRLRSSLIYMVMVVGSIVVTLIVVSPWLIRTDDAPPLQPPFDAVLSRCSDTLGFDNRTWFDGVNPFAILKDEVGEEFRPARGTYFAENRVVAHMHRACGNQKQGFVTNVFEFATPGEAQAFHEIRCRDCIEFVPDSLRDQYDLITDRYSYTALAPGAQPQFTISTSWNDDNTAFVETFSVSFVHERYVLVIGAYYNETQISSGLIIYKVTNRQWDYERLLMALASITVERLPR